MEIAAQLTTREVDMGLFGRLRGRRSSASGVRTSTSADARHLAEFVSSHAGVEGFVEPRTSVTETTILLVAHDGEWTRRRVDGPSGAAEFARKQAIPLYDPAVVGYPQRMRDYNARKRSSGG